MNWHHSVQRTMSSTLWGIRWYYAFLKGLPEHYSCQFHRYFLNTAGWRTRILWEMKHGIVVYCQFVHMSLDCSCTAFCTRARSTLFWKIRSIQNYFLFWNGTFWSNARLKRPLGFLSLPSDCRDYKLFGFVNNKGNVLWIRSARKDQLLQNYKTLAIRLKDCGLWELKKV